MFGKVSLILGILGAASFLGCDAQAAVVVLGNSPAHACFEAADMGSTDLSSCTFALEEMNLSTKDRASTYINRGIIYARIGDTNSALADYDKGLTTDSNVGEGYVDRGAALITLKHFADALEDIDRGIQLGTNKLQNAYYDRAIAHESLGNVRAAYDDYKMAVQIKPDFTPALEQLMRFRVVQKHEDGA